ncbi:MAG TPA: PAS domain S-box protein [Verrucomicrobiae bacterium]|nr:PAS domain S-box protein [Verrucomicrobiae bacterium]
METVSASGPTPVSERRFAAIVKQVTVGISQVDVTGRFLFVNDRFCQITGYPRRELLELQMQAITAPEHLQQNMLLFERLWRDGTSFVLEKEYVRKDGARVWVSNSVAPVVDDLGKTENAVCVTVDISARKRAEASACETLERYERQVRLFEGVASTTPDFVYLFDLQGRFLYANRRLLEVWGMVLNDIVGKTCRELGYEQWHHDMHMREIAQVINTKSSIKGEVPFKAPGTGIFGVYEYIFTPVIGPDGKIELIAGTTRDVTDRKRSEQALRESEERYRELFTSMAEGFCVVEKIESPAGIVDFRHVAANPAVPHQSGVEMVAGRTVRDILGTEAEDWIRIYDEVATFGKPLRLQRDLRSGSRTLEVYAFRVGDGTRRQVGVVFHDITERKQAERALAEAQQQLQKHAEMLEKAVAERTARLQETIAELEAFSYSVSHDMRSPLRAIEGYARVLVEDYRGEFSAEALGYIDRMQKAAARLDLLVRDILTYSKVAKGEITLSPVSLAPLIDGVIDHYPDIAEHKAGVVVDVSRCEQVLGHEAYLTQCVSNLLRNAVKFVAPGVKPLVKVECEDRGGSVRLWFRDNGIGIAPEHRHRLFHIFGRIHPESRFPGTGIGLAIVKKAMERMEGSVGFESDPASGTSFWIELTKA